MLRTKREVIVNWGPGATPLSRYTTTIPAGHPVEAHTDGFGRKWFFADPAGLVDSKAEPIKWHDAVHYGIGLDAEDVTDTEVTPADLEVAEDPRA